MHKVEQNLSTAWLKWAKYNTACNFIAEIKWCPTGRFNFKSGSYPKEHRLLLQAKHSSLIHKQSDIAMLGTLCDVWGLHKCEAWVILFFDKKKFYMINVDSVATAIESGKKSLSEADAVLIAEHVGILGIIDK